MRVGTDKIKAIIDTLQLSREFLHVLRTMRTMVEWCAAVAAYSLFAGKLKDLACSQRTWNSGNMGTGKRSESKICGKQHGNNFSPLLYALGRGWSICQLVILICEQYSKIGRETDTCDCVFALISYLNHGRSTMAMATCEEILKVIKKTLRWFVAREVPQSIKRQFTCQLWRKF